MDKELQQRLNLISEMEYIKTDLIKYMAPNVSLKLIIDLGQKDIDGNKKKFYNEIRYESNKYKNTDHLINVNFSFNSYLLLEYPNPNYVEGDSTSFRKSSLMISKFAMDDLSKTMVKFNEEIPKCFTLKDGKLMLLSDKVKIYTSYPTLNSTISFKADVFVTRDDIEEIGVQITINNEYSFIISGETSWPDFLYCITKCDLNLYAFTLMQPYMAMLPGMSITEFDGSNLKTYSKYSYGMCEDPDDIVNSEDSVGVYSLPVSKEDKKKKFFNS